MKTCGVCRLSLEAAMFHRRSASVDGLSHTCRDCQRTRDSERPMTDARRKKMAEYAKTQAGMAAKARAQKRYRESRAAQENGKKWQERNPTKRHAHVLVGNALRSGRLHKGACERCGSRNTHAHHEDYSKPLAVMWLCPPHHKERHAELEAAGIDPMNRSEGE